jgi:hypothetical protein
MNTKQPRITIYIFIFSLLISACAPGQLFGPTLTPTPTPMPVPGGWAGVQVFKNASGQDEVLVWNFEISADGKQLGNRGLLFRDTITTGDGTSFETNIVDGSFSWEFDWRTDMFDPNSPTIHIKIQGRFVSSTQFTGTLQIGDTEADFEAKPDKP